MLIIVFPCFNKEKRLTFSFKAEGFYVAVFYCTLFMVYHKSMYAKTQGPQTSLDIYRTFAQHTLLLQSFKFRVKHPWCTKNYYNVFILINTVKKPREHSIVSLFYLDSVQNKRKI